MFWLVGIGAYCNDFTAQFLISFQNVYTWIRLTKTGTEAGGVQFNAFSGFQNGTKNPVNDIGVFLIRIVLIFSWTVTYNIIQMTISIEIWSFFYTLQDGFKIFLMCFVFTSSLKEFRIVGIFAVADMRRTDNEVKVMIFCIKFECIS